MLDVRLRRDGDGRLSAIVANGHTGWAEHGEDIVCAAASAVLQAAWYGLSEVARVPVSAEREAGRLFLEWPPETRDRADVRAIVTTAALSVERIAEQYPQHVRVIDENQSENGGG